MTKFVTKVANRPATPVNNGHIFTVPIARRISIGVSNASGLKIGPNAPNTRVFVWKELPQKGNIRWFQVTGLQRGNIIVEAKSGANVVSYIHIAVPSLHRTFPWVVSFLNQTLYTALEISCRTRISLPALLGHSAHEASWGRSRLCRTYNAWFGITATPGAPRAVQAGGRWHRTYNSFRESLEDYIVFVERTYPGAWSVRANTDRYINLLGTQYDPATKATYPTAWRNMLRDGNLRELENLKDSCP
jgi:hypothetical protein